MDSIQFPPFPTTKLVGKDVETKPFELNPRHFVDLLQYVELGMSFPPNAADFESRYHEEGLKRYLKPNEILYEALRLQLPLIHDHCGFFKERHSERMGQLGNHLKVFAESAASLFQTMENGLNISIENNSDRNSQAYQDAFHQLSEAVNHTADCSRSLESECRELVVGVSKFKADCTADRDEIDRLLKQMPDPHAKAQSHAERLNQLRGSLIQIDANLNAKQEEYNKKLLYHKAAQRDLGAFNFLDVFKWTERMDNMMTNTNFDDLKREKENLERELNETIKDQAQEETFNVAFADISNLNANLFSEQQNLSGALNSLQQLAGISSNIQTMFDRLEHDTEGVFDQLRDSGDEFEIKLAIEELTEARQTWNAIARLAQRFQDEASFNSLSNTSSFQVLGANFGGQNVENVVEALVKNNSLYIDTNNLFSQGFPDPWYGVPKSISILYRLPGGAIGLFNSTEGSGAATLQASGNLNSPSRPADNSLWIAAVVYGNAQITDAHVFDVLYNHAASRAPFEVSNGTFGRDPWYGVPKTCAIYYEYDNGPMRCLAGRESTFLCFDY